VSRERYKMSKEKGLGRRKYSGAVIPRWPCFAEAATRRRSGGRGWIFTHLYSGENDFTTAKLQNYKTAKLQNCKTAKLQNFRTLFQQR
jgi:hypothetical protein